MAVAVAVSVALEVMAVAPAVPAMSTVATTVPAMSTVPASDGRAIDRQRGSAQCKNCDRRYNEFLDPSHWFSPELCRASIALL